MLEKIISYSLKNRVLVLLIAVILTISSLLALQEINIDALPDLSDVQVIVTTEYAGQAPQIVEDQVTYPLTTSMLSVPKAKNVRAFSFFGLSMVYVIFEEGTDIYWARSRVLEVLSSAKNQLPDSVAPQLGPDASGVGWIYMYALSDFSQRAEFLRNKYDLNHDGFISKQELPILPKFDDDKTRKNWFSALFRLNNKEFQPFSKEIGSPAFAKESVHYLEQSFDKDSEKGISSSELLEAFNFRGIDLEEIRTIQDWFIKYELMSLKGISEVASIGGYVKQYQIEIDPIKMQAYNLSLAQVKKAVQRSHKEVGGRLLEMSESEFMVHAKGYLTNIDDLEKIAIKVDHKTNSALLLKQVAHISIGPDIRRGLTELNGKGEVVSGIAVMRSGENALQVIERLNQRLKTLNKSLPAGLEIHTAYDRSKLIERSVKNLKSKILEEMIVVALISLLFLLHIPSAFVAIIIIPMSLLIAFLMMFFLNIGFNIMSLGGIAIAVGVMVDASVVMVENLHKHKEKESDLSHFELVMRASKEVGPSLFYSLLIMTISFLPVFSLEAQEGKLFIPLALTKTFAMAASSILSITVLPVLMFYFVRGKIMAEDKNPVSRILIKIYKPLLQKVLHYPKSTLLITFFMMLASLYPVSQLGSEFMPPLNEGDILYMPTTPPGMSISKAKELLQQTDRLIYSHPQVKQVLGKSGRAQTATDPAPLNMFESTIILTEKSEWPAGQNIEKIIKELDSMVQFPGLTNAWTMPIKTRLDMLATGIKTPIGIKLLGSDLDVLQKLGEDIEGKLNALPEVSSVYAERATGGNYLNIDIDREKIARYGLQIADVQDVIQSVLGGMNIASTVEGLKRFPINIRYPREYREDIEDINHISIQTPMGYPILLAAIADIKITKAAPMIKSENARQTIWIFMTLNTSDLGGFVLKGQKILNEQITIPQGTSIRWSGQYTYMQRVASKLKIVIPMTLLLIILLLFFHFKSLSHTLMIVSTLPFALAGGFWLLYFLEFNNSVATAVGFIALFGLATETGILMFVYLDESYYQFKAQNRLQSNGDWIEMVTVGAVDRVRPKIMTVATTIIGLMPILISDDTGSRVMKRIAAPMVGGLISSTILTLLVLPALYLIVQKWQQNKYK